MRIVYLADAPYVHTRRWIQHFASRGDECEVISFRPAAIEGARVHYVDGFEKLGKARYLVHARRVGGLIEDLKPDLVHALHLTSYGFLGALAGVRPLVISVWGTDILEAPGLTPFHRWLTRFSLARAGEITATGLHLASATARYAPQGKPITVIPYGVDLTKFAPVERGERRPLVIGTTARLSVEKGVRYLIEAFALLRQRLGPDVSLRIAGDGPERAKLRALARDRGVEESTQFLGEIAHAEMPAFLGSIDIFALPSVYEGFGVAAVEAAATGLPVVGSRVYGIPDVVQDGRTGLLVPAKEPAALAQALETLARDPARRRAMGAAGREFVAGHYDWDENTAQMERLYEIAVTGRRQEAAVWT
jgi:glycosyltransferase involved in cell wall biosynthesis